MEYQIIVMNDYAHILFRSEVRSSHESGEVSLAAVVDELEQNSIVLRVGDQIVIDEVQS